MEISDLKRAAMLLIIYNTIQKMQGLSDETLYICVAQGAAKLQEVKVGGKKKDEKSGRTHN